MMNPRHALFAERIRSLIDEGERVIGGATGRSDFGYTYIKPEQSSDLHGWVAKVENVLRSLFGEQSAHFIHYSKFAYDGRRNHLQNVGDIVPIIGTLRGALDDLENGFLGSQEFLLSAALFDDVLEQAEHLCSLGYKDASAVLCRVVLEDALRKIARECSSDATGKASSVNDGLKKIGRFNQPVWRKVQVWLDIGNAAAHGEFDKYRQEDVENFVNDLRRFLEMEFRPGP